MILWTFGIPTFAFILLYREKRMNIDRIYKIPREMRSEEEIDTLYNTKVKFGFLFSGYKMTHLYWEIVIMYRKLLIIASAVFLSTVSPEMQVLVALFILILFLLLHIKFQPYET